MPLGPLHAACVRPAPKSRFVVFELLRTRAMWAGANAHRIVIRALIVRPLFPIVGARLPAICREPAANPIHAVYQAQPSRQILLPLRGRSSECGPEQARSYSRERSEQDGWTIKNAMSVSSSQRCSCTRQARHYKSRLGCRLNAGGVELAERHGCRESRPPPWMADGGGPTERRRSEGTRRSRAKPGVQTLGHLIAPTLCVVARRLTLCVTVDAERPDRHPHAERGDNQQVLRKT